MGIFIYKDMNLLKVTNESIGKAYSYAKKYIENSSLSTIDYYDSNKEIKVLTAAKEKSKIHSSGKKINYFTIYGDYTSKNIFETFEIYDCLEGYLENQTDLLEEIHKMSDEEKAQKQKELEENPKHLNGPENKYLVSIWNNKTQGLPYHIDILAIGLIYEHFTNKGIVTYGDITRSHCIEAIKRIKTILGLDVDFPTKWSESVEDGYKKVSMFLRLLGGYRLLEDDSYSINSEINDAREAWKYSFGCKPSEKGEHMIYRIISSACHSMESTKKEDPDTIETLEYATILELTKHFKILWDKNILDDVLNSTDKDFINKIKYFMFCNTSKVDAFKTQIQQFFLHKELIDVLKGVEPNLLSNISDEIKAEEDSIIEDAMNAQNNTNTPDAP